MEGGERGDDRNAQYIPLAVKKYQILRSYSNFQVILIFFFILISSYKAPENRKDFQAVQAMK